MHKRSIQTIVIALCTSTALVGLAFFQRYGSGVRVSQTTLYFAAAIICISPVIYRLLRCHSRLNRPSNG